MFLGDPLRQPTPMLHIGQAPPVLYENALGPDWQQHLRAPPALRLQPLKLHNRADASNITLPPSEPVNPSDISTVINATTQRYAYQHGMLEGHGPLHYTLTDLNASQLTSHYGGQWGLCVEGWWQCARLAANTVVGLGCPLGPRAYDMRPTYWLVFKPLFAGATPM